MRTLPGENINLEKGNSSPEYGRYPFPKVNIHTSCLVQNCDLGQGSVVSYPETLSDVINNEVPRGENINLENRRCNRNKNEEMAEGWIS